MKAKRQDKSISGSAAKQTAGAHQETTMMNKAKGCSQSQRGRQETKDQTGQSVPPGSKDEAAPRPTQASRVKGRLRAQVLAMDPTWGSTRAFIAHSWGGSQSRLEPRWKEAAYWAAEPFVSFLSKCVFKGSPSLPFSLFSATYK